MYLSPSILTTDLGALDATASMLNSSDADWIHFDVMDGVFVPNITFGMPIVEALKKRVSKTLDVHLMITQPERYITAFKKAGADILTIHAEACVHLDRTLNAIKNEGMLAGVALNPSTPIEFLHNILYACDVVLLMSVNPGFGGQKFIPSTLNKIMRVKNMRDELNSSAIIQIDGGVNLTNAAKILDYGGDCLVAGNAIFASENPSEVIAKFKKLGNLEV